MRIMYEKVIYPFSHTIPIITLSQGHMNNVFHFILLLFFFCGGRVGAWEEVFSTLLLSMITSMDVKMHVLIIFNQNVVMSVNEHGLKTKKYQVLNIYY